MHPTPAISDDLRHLLQRLDTNKPSTEDLAALDHHFDRNPELYQDLFGLAAVVRRVLLEKVTANAVGQSAIRREIADLQAVLGRDQATALDQLLIDHLIVCWLRYHWTEGVANQHMAATVATGTPQADQHAYWDKRLSAAQRRYLRAIETLARVRKMQLPTVQVNIGENQVNVVT